MSFMLFLGRRLGVAQQRCRTGTLSKLRRVSRAFLLVRVRSKGNKQGGELTVFGI